MITETERNFMQHWETVREPHGQFMSKLMRGLPMAMLFGFPIVLSLLAVRLFAKDWYMKLSKTSSGTFMTVVLAMFIIIVFYAFFRMHHKWEMNEQLYQELKFKEKKQQDKTPNNNP